MLPFKGLLETPNDAALFQRFPVLNQLSVKLSTAKVSFTASEGSYLRETLSERETASASTTILSGKYAISARPEMITSENQAAYFAWYRGQLHQFYLPRDGYSIDNILFAAQQVTSQASVQTVTGAGNSTLQETGVTLLPLLVTGGYVRPGDSDAGKKLLAYLDSDDLDRKIEAGLLLLNFDVFQELLDQADALSVLATLVYGLDSSGNLLKLAQLRSRLAALNKAGDLVPFDTQTLLSRAHALVKSHLEELMRFDIELNELRVLDAAGTFHIKTTKKLIPGNFSSYDLTLSYMTAEQSPGGGGKQEYITVEYDWNLTEADITGNTVPFAFSEEPVTVTNIASPITLRVKGYDGVSLWEKEFDKDDPALGSVRIEVPLYAPPGLKPANESDSRYPKRLRGQVIDGTGRNQVKNLAVVLRVKEKAEDENWHIAGAALTDNMGNFSFGYPPGVYARAEALVSAAPGSPAVITVRTDAESVKKKQTIDDGFIYLLLQSELSPGRKDAHADCECGDPKKIGRLPDHEDLINSDAYTQDIGGSCVNLSTPNRTLTEYNYFAIVRTSDPDVANYSLKRTEESITAPDGTPEHRYRYVLSSGDKIKRQPVGLHNPILWQDDPSDAESLSLYQSVTVATGHVLHFKSTWKADGYSLGDLIYSLPLAPGQKKQIVISELSRMLRGSEDQQLSQSEMLAASLLSERTITDTLSGNISENLQGSSSASTGGFGVAAGASYAGLANIGISGGYSNSDSDASQTSARNVVQGFEEKLRQSISQKAKSYRENNAAVVTTVGENQRFTTQSEVVSNHNHCHALTMMYFEVLRHYAIFQELTAVEECIFVPLLMTHFTRENIHKWRDVLAAHLLPRPASTYLPPAVGQDTLVKAFDANQRIQTNYANVDYPVGTFSKDTLAEVWGEVYLRINFERPKTRYDRVKTWPLVAVKDRNPGNDIWAFFTFGLVGLLLTPDTKRVEAQRLVDDYITVDAVPDDVPPVNAIRVNKFGEGFFERDDPSKAAWEGYARLLGLTVDSLFNEYFKGRLISEWDGIYYNVLAPELVRQLAKNMKLSPVNADFTPLSDYYGGEQVIRFNFRASNAPITREDVKKMAFTVGGVSGSGLDTRFAKLIVENASIRYRTSHFTGSLYSGYLGDDLSATDSVEFQTPLSPEELRNPREEDRYLVRELLEHLNSNLEYYNKVLWRNLDPDRRYMLLDGFHLQTYDDLNQPSVHKSLASVVRNELLAVAGNSLVFPVASGYKIDRSYIIARRDEGAEESVEQVTLFDHYKPLTPPPPYRISIPTRGVFCEAVMGACNACEKIETNRTQDWDRFKTDEPTPIGTVTPATPQPTDYKPAFKDFAAPIINIQNAPTEPAPGAGLAGLSQLLGQSGVFKDITGLEQNQKNAIQTYTANLEAARQVAELASKSATQSHNTKNSDQIMSALSSARASGALTEEQHNDLLLKHLSQQIDGGKSLEARNKLEARASEPSLTKAAVEAARDGKKVKAEETSSDGATKSVEIGEGASGGEVGSEVAEPFVLAEVRGGVQRLAQTKKNDCWAVAAAMMQGWRFFESPAVSKVLAVADSSLSKRYNKDLRLTGAAKESLLDSLGLVGEGPANYLLSTYVNLMKKYGPLWVTIDSNKSEGVFSAHAIVLTKITGTGTGPDDLKNASMTFIDPANGTLWSIAFLKFATLFEQVVRENTEAKPFIQVVHFRDEVSPDAPIRKLYELDTVNRVVTPKRDNGKVMTIQQLSNAEVVFFRGGMQICADGAPKAYAPDDSIALDYKAAAGGEGNWYGLVTDDAGKPLTQKIDGKEYYIAKTTMSYDDAAAKDAKKRYVDASTVSFMVTPPAVYSRLKMRYGDLGLIYDTKTGNRVFVIACESGPVDTQGEASIRVFENLDLYPPGAPHNAKKGGIDEDRFLYVIFSRTNNHPRWKELVGYRLSDEDIQKKGAVLLDAFGGQDFIDQLLGLAVRLKKP